MRKHIVVLSFYVLLCSCLVQAQGRRRLFPKDFVFGVSSSAFQYEGAVKEGGRGPSVWDAFSHTSNIEDGSNADVSVDQYHRFKEDIDLMVDLGINAYRLSISWTRILPNGTLPVNEEGVKHYNDVINALVSRGLQPYVTLWHFDQPQALEDAYGSVLSPRIAVDFAAFAEVCFERFGDRVKHWITLNEPHTITNFAYNYGYAVPPLRCSKDVRSTCKAGDSSTEPYKVGHNYLLSHAAAVDVYRKKFKAKQGGKIGITLGSVWYEPLTNSTEDVQAAERATEFNLGWFLSPIIFGDYPEVMKKNVGNKLPSFTSGQQKMLRKTSDFVGINHYTTLYASSAGKSNPPVPSDDQPGYYKHTKLHLTGKRNGVEIGPISGGNYVYPPGMKMLMDYIRTRYNRPTIYITENGLADATKPGEPLYKVLVDNLRITYLSGHLKYLSEAIREGSDVRGYFVWSLMDNWEWNSGKSVKYGLYHVDFERNLTRIPKKSAFWYKHFVAKARK